VPPPPPHTHTRPPLVRHLRPFTINPSFFIPQALGSILLYKYERKQFHDARSVHKTEPLTALYGAEHLLRLFVKLPELLARARMQPEHLTVLLAKLAELLKFMQANKAKYFASEYMQQEKAYMEWWSNE